MEPPPPPGGRDSRFNNNIGYNMNLLSGGGGGETSSLAEIYGRQSTNLQQLSSPRHTMMVSGGCGGGGIRGGILTSNKSGEICYDERRGGMGLPPPSSQQQQDMQGSGGGGGGGGGGSLVDNVCGGVVDDDLHNDEPLYNLNQPSKKSPPNNGKKTKGRVKIKMEYIENKLRRYTTFSKRKTGIMKKAYELSTLTGTQVMLLVASETGHVYTFATRKLQPMITSEAGKALIQTCLNSPDPPAGAGPGGVAGGDQRMSATGFEETELTYNISDEDSKENDSCSSGIADATNGGIDIDDLDDDDDDEISDEDDTSSSSREKIMKLNDTNTFPIASDQKSSPPPPPSPPLAISEQINKERGENPTTFNKIPRDCLSPIISQIQRINNALILSNKTAAAAASTSTSSNVRNQNNTTAKTLVTALPTTTTTTIRASDSIPKTSSEIHILPSDGPIIQLPNNQQAVPVLIKSASGVGFFKISENVVLGMTRRGKDTAANQWQQTDFVSIPINLIPMLNNNPNSDSTVLAKHENAR